MPKYTIIRDTREQQGWFFTKVDDPTISGTIIGSLKSGDYTVQGYQDKFVIERKASTGEIAKNICEARFERELERLEEIPLAFVVLEFTYDDILTFPQNSGIPPRYWRKLRIRPKFILKRIYDLGSPNSSSGFSSFSFLMASSFTFSTGLAETILKPEITVS